MTRQLTNALAITVLVGAATLAAAFQNRPALAGKWRMTIEFADEARSAGLDLELNGQKIKGRFIAAFAGGDMPIEGTVMDDTVTFSGTTTGGPHPGMTLEFSATLKGSTLAGSMSAPFGDFPWTAERLDAVDGQ